MSYNLLPYSDLLPSKGDAMKTFYTYLWLREDGTPYYVGKGTGRRGFVCFGHKVRCPLDCERIIVQEWPSEADAFEAEKFLISFYGRRKTGTGCLANLSDGGGGSSGYHHTEEAKKRIKLAALGVSRHYPRPGRRGMSPSLETIAKTRNTQRHSTCPQGHPFDEANTYVRKDTGRRQCKECRRRRTCPR
jgi:hypothetical protein